MNYPIPSYSTITRRLKGLPFVPGIQLDVLDLMAAKLRSFPTHAQMMVLKVCYFFFYQEGKVLCLISLFLTNHLLLQIDEMDVVPGLQYDPVTNTVLGSVALPPTPGKKAKKLLTCSVASLSITSKWWHWVICVWVRAAGACTRHPHCLWRARNQSGCCGKISMCRITASNKCQKIKTFHVYIF